MLGRHVRLLSPVGPRGGALSRCGVAARGTLARAGTLHQSAVTRASARALNVHILRVPSTRHFSRVTRVLHAAGGARLAQAARGHAAGVWSVLCTVPATHPLAFGAVLSALKTAGADLVVQKLLEGKAEIDWKRCGL